MMRSTVFSGTSACAELALRVSEHRLDDVAAVMRVLRTARRNLHARVGRPDDLVGGRFDLLALEEVVALLVAGEVEDLVAVRAQGLGDREEHRVAQAAAGEQHVLAVRDLGRRAGRPHHEHRLARLQVRALPARHAHLEGDHRQQALLLVHPRAGQREALHQHPRPVRAGSEDGRCRFEVLQAVELAGLEVPGGGRRLDDHLDDGRRQPDDALDAGEEVVVEAGREALPFRRPRRGARRRLVARLPPGTAGRRAGSRRGPRPWPSRRCRRTSDGCRRNT